jgi:hypothetical protein
MFWVMNFTKTSELASSRSEVSVSVNIKHFMYDVTPLNLA